MKIIKSMKNLLILFSLILLLGLSQQVMVANPPSASQAPAVQGEGCSGVSRGAPLTFKGKYSGKNRERALNATWRFLRKRARDLPTSFKGVASIKEASLLGLRLLNGRVERFFPIMCGQFYDPIVRRSAQHNLNHLKSLEENIDVLISQEMTWHVQRFAKVTKPQLPRPARGTKDIRWSEILFLKNNPEATQWVLDNKKIDPVKDPKSFCVAVAKRALDEIASPYKEENRSRMATVMQEFSDTWNQHPRGQEFRFDLLEENFGISTPGGLSTSLTNALEAQLPTPLINQLRRALQIIADQIGDPDLLSSDNFTRQAVSQAVEPLHRWLEREENQTDLQATLGSETWFIEFLLEVLGKKGKVRKGNVPQLVHAAHLSSAILAMRERDRLARGEFESPDNSMWRYTNDAESLGLQFGNEYRYSFFRRLGTAVLSYFSGFFPHRDGINLLLVHGSGTTNSSAQSWKALITGLVNALSGMTTAIKDGIGFNPIAPDFAFAGVGPKVAKSNQVLSFLDRTIHSIRAMARESGVDGNPFVYFGRSSGALYALSHALFYQGPRNLVDAYIGMSFSHPETMEKQIENIYAQRDAGFFPNVDEQSLSGFKKVSDKTWEKLQQLKREKEKQLATLGDHMLFFQGNSDEDGNISREVTAISGLRDLRDRFVPLVHVYEFYNPLQNHPIFEIGVREGFVTPYSFEATHFLLSTNANMRRDAWQRLENTFREGWAEKYPDKPVPDLPEVRDADLPALMDQFTEMMAVMFGFFDYLAENNSPFPEMVRARQVFSEYKRKILGPELAASTTYFDWYSTQIINQRAALGKKKNPDVASYKAIQSDPTKWGEVPPNTRGLLGRLKRAENYWQEERSRIRSIRGEP